MQWAHVRCKVVPGIVAKREREVFRRETVLGEDTWEVVGAAGIGLTEHVDVDVQVIELGEIVGRKPVGESLVGILGMM